MGQLTNLNIGQSTCIGIGGDPIIGTTHTDAIKLFNDDPDTHAIVDDRRNRRQRRGAGRRVYKATREEAGDRFHRRADRASWPSRMGHAGAIISGGSGKAEDKMAAMTAAGIIVCPTPADIGEKVKSAL